ncbi:MAG TPA: phytanoyl-CoA dioxygenase family protein [Acidimicrobiales bacterium]
MPVPGETVPPGAPAPAAEPALHPWNRSFAWHDRTGPFRALTEAQVRHYDEHGYLVLDELVPPDLLARATAETDRFEAEVDAFLRSVEGERFTIAEAGAITFSVHLAARSPTLRRLVTHPRLVGIAGDLIGPDVRLYWDQAVYKKPEKPRRFPWHQDNGYAYVEPQQYLTIWLALTDATVDNGCPRVVPGLHRRGTLAHHYVDPLGWECLDDPPGQLAAPVPAGGAVVFSSLTPHLTGPNTTGAVRKAYIVQYAPHGAERLDGDPAAGPPTARVPCDAPDRQFPVLVGGRSVDGG